MMAGAAVAAAGLLAVAIILGREPGSALKAIVAVWLAALPVLGLGALVGWLLEAMIGATARGRADGGRRR